MKHYLFAFIFFIIYNCITIKIYSQNASIQGKITHQQSTIEFAVIHIFGTNNSTKSDEAGNYEFKNLNNGKYILEVFSMGFTIEKKEISITENNKYILNFDLKSSDNSLDEMVVTGTLKEVRRMESPVSVEIYEPTYFKKNPTPNIFDALQNVNGVRPQLNCNICNTGDIHVNGLEGPYTMVLIDGMPIVSSLSTVYGLSGIPNSLVERIEIVKGPASSLYGSEAVGGLINIITKKPQNAPKLAIDLFSTSWQEYSADIGFITKISQKTNVLTGINYFNYQKIHDKNNDFFTDVTLQHRISIFQKWNIERKENRILNLAGRYFFENRWGGETNWTPEFRGGDSIYGESIYTKRYEFLANYQLPTKEKLMLSLSYNNHDQDSRYGTTSYLAIQNIFFTQLTWDKKIKNHDLLAGLAVRYTFYDDNTPATYYNNQNGASRTWLPGIFLQDEITFNKKHKILAGFRYDYNSLHGNIYTPRFAYKYTLNDRNIFRINMGTGYRVVNLFTEDHAALTGARSIEIKSELKPERSYNTNINYVKKIYTDGGTYIGLDASVFYTYFDNRIIGDYETNPNKIIYDNLNGYAVSKGVSLNTDIIFKNGIKILAGGTFMDVSLTQNNIKQQQILTEKFTGTWAISYKIKKINLSIDYTGNVYSPMRLPILGSSDPRKLYSPWWSIQNIQLVYSGIKKVEIYGGVKNLLDFTPNKNNPFIIARSNDPFDKKVQFDGNGQVLKTAENPYGLTFDPNYVYAPNQGIRGFLGVRFTLD